MPAVSFFHTWEAGTLITFVLEPFTVGTVHTWESQRDLQSFTCALYSCLASPHHVKSRNRLPRFGNPNSKVDGMCKCVKQHVAGYNYSKKHCV